MNGDVISAPNGQNARMPLKSTLFLKPYHAVPTSEWSVIGKLSLAIALIGRSPVLFLDEPSAAVDAGAKRHLWKAPLQRFLASAGSSPWGWRGSIEMCLKQVQMFIDDVSC